MGFLSPLNFEKPRFFNSEIKTTIKSYGNDDPAYNLYKYQLENRDFSNKEVGWLASDLWMNGKPVEASPRVMLKKQIKKLGKKGFMKSLIGFGLF